jgi:hypothetical protein
MNKPYKLTLVALALILSALVFSIDASAQTAPNFVRPRTPNQTPAPKVVFVGDQVTANWPLTQTNPNWINQGVPGARSGNVTAAFQTAINLHPTVIHIMVGAIDSSFGDMGMEPVLAVPGFLGPLQTMVSEAKAAKIQVILGMEPFTGLPLNDIVAAYGAQQGIPVINYQNVETASSSSTYGYNTYLPTAYGYQQMTALLENVLPTVGLQLGGGYLQNTYQLTGGAPVFTNVNEATPSGYIMFTAVGWFNNNPTLQQQINTNLAGANGTWTSSNPLVMTINQQGGAVALTPGTTTIRYTSLPASAGVNGVAFSEWVMNVVPYGSD